MSDEKNYSDNIVDFTKIEPWNTRECAIKVNSIRCNQDYTLLTLGTSKGYRIFLTSTLRPAHQPTDEVNKLGDINIAMSYYKSSLVFLLPSRNNQDYKSREIIVFDDFYQKEFASFKEKSEDILNFFVSKNVVFIITLCKIIVLEIFTFKIIDIINNINSMNQLLSYNYFDHIAYTDLKDKKRIFLRYYHNENNKIVSHSKKSITYNFDYVQTFQLSRSGHILAIVSIYGNKIHLYYTQNGELKDCLLISQYMETIVKVLFSEKSNYLFVLKIDNKFNIYKIQKEKVNKPKCVCSKYDDSKVEPQIKEENNSGIFGYFRKYSKNKDLKDAHAYSEIEGELSFVYFDKNKNKDLILINKNGQYIKYQLKKKPCGHISPSLCIQWE